MAGSRSNADAVARRDIVWDAVLRALGESPASIKFQDVTFQLDRDVSDRTIQRTMSAMRNLGWLRKDKESGHYWYPGEKAIEYLESYDEETVERIREHMGDLPEEETENEYGEVGRIVDPAELEEQVDERVEQAIDERVEDLAVPGSGKRADERREGVRQVLRYLHEQGSASPAELKQAFFEQYSGGYETERSWWKNLIYPSLREVLFVESGGEGSQSWIFVEEKI